VKGAPPAAGRPSELAQTGATLTQDSSPPGIDRDTTGFRTVKPRKQKKTPSRRRREAERLTQRIEDARAERRDPWGEGGQSKFAAEQRERELAKRYVEKRSMRREIYAQAPELEGCPFWRNR